jgi:hypothetical protein
MHRTLFVPHKNMLNVGFDEFVVNFDNRPRLGIRISFPLFRPPTPASKSGRLSFPLSTLFAFQLKKKSVTGFSGLVTDFVFDCC